MRGFAGFPDDDGQIALPASFFSELLFSIDDMAELKVTLFLLYAHTKAERPPLFSVETLLQQSALVESLAQSSERPASEALQHALERAAARGTLLRVVRTRGNQTQNVYLVNDAAGRQVAQAIESGEWDEGQWGQEPAAWRVERPNIFVLYEQNIGLLQPLIADELREAEKAYPMSWIEEAFRIAVERNVRNWRYIRAILERWAREGKSAGSDSFDSEFARRRYVEGKYGDIIKR